MVFFVPFGPAGLKNPHDTPSCGTNTKATPP